MYRDHHMRFATRTLAAAVVASATATRAAAQPPVSPPPPGALGSTAGAPSGPAAAPDYPAIARRIVRESAHIRPGQVVMVYGTPGRLALIEALAVEAARAGAEPVIQLGTDRVFRALVADAPAATVGQVTRFDREAWALLDVYIALPGFDDVKGAVGGLPDGPVAKVLGSFAEVQPILNHSRIQWVNVNAPSGAAEALRLGIRDTAAYVRTRWAALGADPAPMAAAGEALRRRLAGAREVRVTTPGGTDLRFTIGARPVVVDAGVMTPAKAAGRTLAERTVTLPGGAVDVAPLETSAGGHVALPWNGCNGERTSGIAFDVVHGTIERLTAATNATCLLGTLAATDSAGRRLGLLHIGLNPELVAIGDFRPRNGAGVVELAFGANTDYGGANASRGGFSFRLNDATVLVDGTPVVDHGRLVASSPPAR